jgi:large subunit ribosomal protein L30e
MDLSKALKSVMSTGKVLIGFKEAKRALAKKEAKMVIVSANCPKDAVEELKKFKVPVVSFVGNNVELGTACGKPFSISTLAILDAGDSNILSAAAGE